MRMLVTTVWRALAVSVVAILLTLSTSWRVEAEPQPAQLVTAAALAKLPSFVSWPEANFTEEQDAIDVCVVADEAIRDILDMIFKKKTAGGRRLSAQSVNYDTKAEGCELLYVPKAADSRLVELIPRVKRSGLLTVGESDRFAGHGGIIRLDFESTGTLQFEINARDAEEASVKLSSQLLQAAKTVKR